MFQSPTFVKHRHVSDEFTRLENVRKRLWHAGSDKPTALTKLLRKLWDRFQLSYHKVKIMARPKRIRYSDDLHHLREQDIFEDPTWEVCQKKFRLYFSAVNCHPQNCVQSLASLNR